MHAFTLIEMVLAIGVAAIALIAVNGVLFAALRLRDVTQNVVDSAAPLDQTVATIRHDLLCIVQPTNVTSGVLSGSFRVGEVNSSGVSETAAIEMYTASGVMNANQPWADIQRVTYELKQPANLSANGRDLYRSVVRNLLTITTPDVEDQFLMSGVKDFTVTCYDGMGWQTSWDTTSFNSVNTNLPTAIRVDIQMAGRNNNNVYQPIVIIVPIDVQTRTNITPTAATSTSSN